MTYFSLKFHQFSSLIVRWLILSNILFQTYEFQLEINARTYPSSVKVSSFWKEFNIIRLRIQVVLIEEFIHLFVTPNTHAFELLFAPRVHCYWSHKTDLNPKSSMNSTTIQTDENSVIDRCPLRSSLSTIKTFSILLDLH